MPNHHMTALQNRRERSLRIIEGSRSRVNAIATLLGGIFTLVGIGATAVLAVRKEHFGVVTAIFTVFAVIAFFFSILCLVVALMPSLGALRPAPNIEALRMEVAAEAGRIDGANGMPTAADYRETWSLEHNWWLKENAAACALFALVVMVVLAVGAVVSTFA